MQGGILKISELIQELEKLKAEHGDIECVLVDRYSDCREAWPELWTVQTMQPKVSPVKAGEKVIRL